MKRSMFSTTYTMVLCIILFTFFIFSTVLLGMVNNYSARENEQKLSEECQKVVQVIKLLNENYSAELEHIVLQSLILSAANSEYDVIVATARGEVTFNTDNALAVSGNNVISKPVLEEIKANSGYSRLGTLGGIYLSQVYSVGEPIVINGEVLGFAFVSSRADFFQGLTSVFFKMLLNSFIVVMLMAFLVCYFFTKRMVYPLREMAHAASRYAKGDFSKKINTNRIDEFGDLSVALNNMAIELSRLEETRSSFVANVSHDLKTPMTVISGYIDGILDGTIPRERQEHYLKIVSDEVKRLSRMVANLLDMASFESGAKKPLSTVFDLVSMCQNILVGFEKRFEEKNIYVEVYFAQKSMNVLADSDMINQVVYNLVDNAIKFSNQDGIITLKVEPLGKKILCSVKNTGEGIMEEDLPKIFDRFYKIDESRTDKRGTGLGLYIVRSVILAHEEKLNVDNQEGKSIEFSFTLPVGKNVE